MIILLNSVSLVSDLLHVTLLNFLERSHGSDIIENRTVCEYLLVCYGAPHTGDAGCSSPQHKPSTRIDILKTVHESIAFSFVDTKRIALVGFPCKAADDHCTWFHLMIASYGTDIPEYKDLLSVKLRNRPASPCHNCLTVKRRNRPSPPCHICLPSKEAYKSNEQF